MLGWRRGGSNPSPLDCQSSALPAELRPRARKYYTGTPPPMQGQFWKRFYGAWNGAGPKGHTIPEIARGARPRCRRPEQSNPRCFRGRVSSEPLSAPSGQFTEPCAARASWSLHKRTGLLRRFPDFRPHAYIRKTGRHSTCGFTSDEFGVLSYPQSNVVNRRGFKMALNYCSI